jgi:hypothetical protein
MTGLEYGERIHRHVHAFFAEHPTRVREFARGPIQSVLPGFHAIELGPGPRNGLWTYASVGAGFAELDGESRLEFLLLAAEPSERHVELLAMVAHYQPRSQVDGRWEHLAAQGAAGPPGKPPGSGR